MAEKLTRFNFISLKLSVFPATNIRACKSFDYGATYSDPATPFVAGANEWYDLTEHIYGSTNNATYEVDLPKGTYRLQSLYSGTWSTISYFEKFYHITGDFDTHILGTDAVTKHDSEDIVFTNSITSITAVNVRDAIEQIAGAGWVSGTDKTLKGHTSDTTAAHAASAISCSVGALTDVESALDDHETRLDTLEAGTASTPANITDISGEIGIDIEWDNQYTVNGILYFFKYLWKHDYETAPTIANLKHESQLGTSFCNINYGTRRFDIAINTDSNLTLYYAIGAWGRGDGFTGAVPNIHWSAVQNTGVVIPKYKQEQIITLSDVNLTQTYVAKDNDSREIDSDEVFPTCSGETGGVPDDNFVLWYHAFKDIIITGIAIYCNDKPSPSSTLKYYIETGGVTSSFTVSSTTGLGTSGTIAVPLTAGETVKIWSLAPNGMGHYQIQIVFEV